MEISIADEGIKELETVDIVATRILVDRFLQKILGRGFPPLPFLSHPINARLPNLL